MQDAALVRVGPVPSLGNIMELAGCMGVVELAKRGMIARELTQMSLGGLSRAMLVNLP